MEEEWQIECDRAYEEKEYPGRTGSGVPVKAVYTPADNDYWRGNLKTPFTHLQGIPLRCTEESVRYHEGQLERLVGFLEANTGRKLEVERL